MEMPGKQNLFLIHGWGFDSRVLHGLKPHLQRQYQVTLPDMPGYGKNSSDINTENIDALAEALIPLIKQESIIGGWSLGGMAAVRIAVKMKNTIRGLVLIASTPCFVKKTDWQYGIEAALIEEMLMRINKGEKEKVLKEFALLVAKGDMNTKKIIRQLYNQLANTLIDAATLINGLNILMSADLREDLQQLKCPVILLLAENDQLVPKSVGENVKKLIPGLRLEYISATGHALFLSNPVEFCNVLNGVTKDIGQ